VGAAVILVVGVLGRQAEEGAHPKHQRAAAHTGAGPVSDTGSPSALQANRLREPIIAGAAASRPAAPDATPQAEVLIHLEGSPRGAKVTDVKNNKILATLPGSLRLRRSQALIKVRISHRGYKSLLKTITLHEDQQVKIKLRRRGSSSAELPDNPFVND